MKNKGFTLIELLAVIVILAIIALIATPIILGIIDDARTESRERTAELVAKGVELAYVSYLYDNDGTSLGSDANACTFMKDYFSMDKAELAKCDTDAKVTANGVEFTVSYADGVATVTPNDNKITKQTVKLATK